MLEQPYRKGHGSMDDISLFLLREFEEKRKREEPELQHLLRLAALVPSRIS